MLRLLAYVAATTSLASAAFVPTLLPSVRSLQHTGHAEIDVTSAFVEAGGDAAARLQSELGGGGAASGLPIRLRLRPGHLADGAHRDAHGAIAGRESYSLELTADSLTITGSAQAGLFYGTRTALQLVRGARLKGGGKLPPLRIVDSPVSSYRGVMVDNVRSPHNATFHMEFVQKLADHKLNVYQLHASDDQGYSLPSLAFPQLPKPALALTAAEAKALQAKAMALHVAIVAEVDLPGHSGWLLSQLPALAAKSKKTGKPCKTIDVQSPAALKIMQTLVTENMALFPSELGLYHLGADEVQYNADCGLTKATYHAFINAMNAFVRSKNKTMIVWEGFDPNPADAPVIDKTVIVSPFDSVHLTPWPHRPHHYYDAGYNIINTDWNPLYLVGGGPGFAVGPEQLSAWDPTSYGNYPNLGNSAGNWQKLPKDNWNDPSYHSRFTALNASCWPDRTQHSPGYIPQPYPSHRLLGGAICSWANHQATEDYIFFGKCFGNGSRYPGNGLFSAGPHLPRPAPRAPIVAERLWSGAALKPQAVLEAVDCAYWTPPPPAPPAPPPTPGGKFTPQKGACRDVNGGVPYARLDHMGPVNFSDCQAKCAQLGERCDALDVDGSVGCANLKGLCNWCAVWGNVTAKDTDGKFIFSAGGGGRACHGDPSAGEGNTCYTRPPGCQSPL